MSHRHTLPASQWEKAAGRSPEWYQETLGDGSPVIIYLHGNAGTRWDESSIIGTLELILMESSGYHMTAQAPGFIHRHNEHKGLWVTVNETENHLFVFIALMSFLQSLNSQSGAGEGTVPVLKLFTLSNFDFLL